jgi:hypothetical protein
LDYYEEIRLLSHEEFQVRRDAQETLEQAIMAKATFWKQRSKHKAIKEGDSNIAFHHAQATQRMRQNYIRMVRVGDVEIINHAGKTSALTNYFTSIIGVSGNSHSVDLDTQDQVKASPRSSLKLKQNSPCYQ